MDGMCLIMTRYSERMERELRNSVKKDQLRWNEISTCETRNELREN